MQKCYSLRVSGCSASFFFVLAVVFVQRKRHKKLGGESNSEKNEGNYPFFFIYKKKRWSLVLN